MASDREVSLIRVGERVQAPSKAALGQDLLNTVQLKIKLIFCFSLECCTTLFLDVFKSSDFY